MSGSKRRLFIPAAALSILAIAFLAGFTVERSLNTKDPPSISSLVALNDSLIREAWNVIDQNYVDRPAVQSETLTYGAIQGMVDALGDTGHSRFLTPRMVQAERSLLRGTYVGVGLEIATRNGKATIVAPLDNSPAFAAGLHSGQQILKVEGRDVSQLPIDQLAERIMGPAGSTVTLSILDPRSGTTFDVPLVRAEIRVSNVSWQLIPGSRFADLRVAAFSAGVTAGVKSALEEIQRQGLPGAVLDLRNNPGGQLSEAIGVASQFLASGEVLLEKDARGVVRPDHVTPGGIAPSLPLVVLIDGGTASAAEIVAGALQSQERAAVAGETSFGTGTVLQMFRLSDGSQILLAVEEWLTPQGSTIWHKGIMPDTRIELKPDAEMMTPSSLRNMTREAFLSGSDLQLIKAVEMLARKTNPSGQSTAAPGTRS
ncbi:MAG: S41 family peptidase [Spirochaetia bacterium]|jgi:carboxyl-terminal processing protease